MGHTIWYTVTRKRRELCVMEYRVEYVRGHIEVYSARGEFLFSADTRQEAVEELQDAA